MILLLLMIGGALLPGSVALAAPVPTAEPPSPGADAMGGQEVEPGASAAEAPVLDSGGVYLGPAPELGGMHYYRIDRTMEGSTLWYSVTSVLEGTTPMVISAYPEGDETGKCRTESLTSLMESDDDFGLRSAGGYTQSDRCAKAEFLTIAVQWINEEVPPQSYQLRVWEEPPLTADNAARQPEANPVPYWIEQDPADQPEATELQPSGTFADAPELADGGYYRLTLEPGISVMRVPLDYGQHAQLLLTKPDKPKESLTTMTSDLQLRWIAPLGGTVAVNLEPENRGDQIYGTVSPLIAWSNRDAAGYPMEMPAVLAGDYYAVINVPDKGEWSEGQEIVLRSDIVADYPGLAPKYDGAAADLPQLDGTTQVMVEETDVAEETAGVPWAWVLGLYALVALLGVLGLVMLLRARRTP